MFNALCIVFIFCIIYYYSTILLFVQYITLYLYCIELYSTLQYHIDFCTLLHYIYLTKSTLLIQCPGNFTSSPTYFSPSCSKLLTPWNCTWTMFHLENRFNLHCKVIPSVIWTFYSNRGTKQVDGKWRQNRKIRLERHAAYTCLYGCFTARGRFLFQLAILEDFGRHEVQRASRGNEPSYFCLRKEPAA